MKEDYSFANLRLAFRASPIGIGCRRAGKIDFGIDNLRIACYYHNMWIRVAIRVAAVMAHRTQTPTRNIWLVPIYSEFTAGWRRCSPLLFALPRHRNSRISAAETMSVADNFLQKQRKQRYYVASATTAAFS